MRVLVTGGAGLIGSHLVDALLDRGAEVSMADHLHRSPKPWFGEALLRGAQLYVADLRDLPALRPAWPRRSTSVSRSPIRPSTPRSTWPEPCRCWRPRARSAPAGW